jgi:hypothetical protein
MLKQSLLIVSLFSLSIVHINASRTPQSQTFIVGGTKYVSRDESKLFNYVQNGCSYLLGNKFHKISAEERPELYHAIISDVRSKCGGGYDNSFYKICVDHKISSHIADLVAKKTKERFQNATSDWRNSETLYKKMKTQLQNEASRERGSGFYGLKKGFFEESLDDHNMVDNINDIMKELHPQAPAAPYYDNQNSQAAPTFLSAFLDWMLSNESAKPTHHEPAPTPAQHYDRPPATNPNWTSTPSAPPAQQPVHSSDNKKLFPTQECSAGCMGDFKEDGLERIFLPCGHDACKDCARNWFINENKNTCPQCRYCLSSTEKQNLKSSLDHPSRQCGCCNTTRNLRTLHCNHKICDGCTYSWIASENTASFKSGCPRCGDRFIYR